MEEKMEFYSVMKGSIRRQDIAFENIYAPNIGTPKYVKQILADIKGDLSYKALNTEDFNTSLTSRYRSSQEKNKGTIALSDIFKQVNLININRTFYPKSTEHTFFFKCTWNIP